MACYRADFPSTYAAAAQARGHIVSFARWAGLAGEALLDFESAVGEALANAAEHGHCEGSHFSVYADVVDGAIVVEVQDRGDGFEGWNSAAHARPPTHSPRGFGIFIMRSLVDHIEYSERGSKVRLIKKLRVTSSEARREA